MEDANRAHCDRLCAVGDDTDLVRQVRALLDAGRPGLALAPCRAYLAAHRDDPVAMHLMGEVYLMLGQVATAEQWLQSAVARAPALRDQPGFVLTRNGIEAAKLTEQAEDQQKSGRFQQAMQSLTRAADLLPNLPWPVNNLGNLCMSLGRLDEAMNHFRAAAYHADRPMRQAHSNLLMAMLHSDRVTPRQLLDEHRAWAGRYPRNRIVAPPPVIDPPDPDRPIRVGYISPDFRRHPVAMFMLPVLTNHDPARCEITCYSDVTGEDAMTRRLRAAGHRWVDCAAMPIEKLFDQIRQDRIDILIDLAVHSGSNRQPLLASRPAPIQMTWLGYAGTTGSPAIDYRITDSVVDPPGLTESHFTERLLRLPEIFWCFAPPEEAPGLVERAGDVRRIRFGTATRLAKITPTCLDLWASLLRHVPDSLLCLAADPFADPAALRDWIDQCAARGIGPDRLDLRPAMDYREYLAFLGSIDIGLDTFPFNGGTTVCHTLWMGTPVVALTGATSAARITASILTALGRPEWIAATPDEWVRINVRLATGTRPGRAALRQQMQRSGLCDGARFARGLEAAFREVFRARCG
mgnify:CR=1 FL=1